jgi:transglutaminase-like putative cysteine protease
MEETPMKKNMKTLVISFVGLLLLCVPTQASVPGDETPVWVQQAAAIKVPTYDEKDVPAVVLVNERSTTVESDGRTREVFNYAIRILQREGREFAVGRAGYIPDSGKVKDFKAWLLRPGSETKRYGKDNILDVAADMNDVYNEYRVTSVVAISDADVGSVFAYSYVREERTVFSQDDWRFQTSLPVISSRYTLTLPTGWRAEAVTFNHPNIEPRVNGTTYSWELSHLPPVPLEPMSPSLSHLVPRLAVSYYAPASTQVAIKTFSNWTEVATWMAELEDPQVQVDDALARKTYELTALAKTEYDKIRAIATYVQNIQYISIQTGLGRGGGYRPHSSIEVFAKSYGDCKDKANLMRAMLKVIGIDAIPVSIYSGDPNYVRADWPSPQQFNHCIIAVKVSEQTLASTIIEHPKLGRLLIFDPTDGETPLGDLPFYLQGSLALVDSRASTELVRMPVTPPDMNQLVRTATLQLQADGAIGGLIQENANGQTAAKFRSEFRQLSKTDYNGMIERWLTAGATSARLDKIEPSDNHGDGKFTLNVEFSAKSYGQLMQDRLLVFKPAVVSRRESLSLTAPLRRHPVVLRANSYSETVKVQLPAGFAVDEVPDPVKLETSFGTYTTSYEVVGGDLVFKRQLSQKATTIPAAQYESVRKFFESIRAAENAPVVLARK